MNLTRRNFLKTVGLLSVGASFFGAENFAEKKVFAAPDETKKFSYFRSAKIDKNIFRIRNAVGDLMYLVEGKNRAALIDTGIGVGDLKNYVQTLTKKPVIVLLTHGHVDHASGSIQFDEVYMNGKDNELFKQHTALETRKGYVGAVNPDLSKNLSDADYQPIDNPSRFKNLQEGMTFDLGGVHLDIFDIQGHTQGMTAILFRENKALLTGDGANMFTFLFSAETTGLKTYEKNLRQLQKVTAGKYDKIYCSHGNGDLTVDYLERLLEDLEIIFAGNDDKIPFDFMGSKAAIAFEIDANHNRLDAGIGNIVYDPARINL